MKAHLYHLAIKLLCIVGPFLFLLPAQSQTNNTFYAAQFQREGRTVGGAIALAQQACNPDTAIPCYIVIDPTMVKWASGTMPAKCTQCVWEDFRTAQWSNVLQAGAEVDARTYGAICNGTTDDTGALQNAINDTAARALTLKLPSFCAISAPLVWPSADNVNIIGAGLTTSGLVAIAPMATMMSKDSTNQTFSQRSTIGNFRLDCNMQATTGMNIAEASLFISGNIQVYRPNGGTGVIFGQSPNGGKNFAVHGPGIIEVYNFAGDYPTIANRPQYGIELRASVFDSDINVGQVTRNARAGLLVAGSNNRIYNAHPWGYGPSGPTGDQNDWPDYGFEVTGTGNAFISPEADTVRVAAFKMSASRQQLIAPTFVQGDASAGVYAPVEIDSNIKEIVVLFPNINGSHAETSVFRYLGTPGGGDVVLGGNFAFNTSEIDSLVTFGDAVGTTKSQVNLNNPVSGQIDKLALSVNTKSRFELLKDLDAETGSDAGSTLKLFSNHDDGTFNKQVFSVTRATGAINFLQPCSGFIGACWTTGTGAPTGACTNGSIYTRTDTATSTTELYICAATAWVAK